MITLKRIMPVILVGVVICYAFAFAADPVEGLGENAFLDPFTLMPYQSQNTKKKSTLTEAEMDLLIFTTETTASTRTGPPVSTYRYWTITPYRPPIRSPWLPW